MSGLRSATERGAGAAAVDTIARSAAARGARFFAPMLSVLLTFSAAGAASGADMNKILRVSFEAGETGFDPTRNIDGYSNRVIEQIYEPLLTYDYLARPARLVPLTVVYG